MDGPLESRCEHRPDRSELDAGPILVKLAQGPLQGGEVCVEPALMQTVPQVEPDLLQMLARTAAGTPAAVRASI